MSAVLECLQWVYNVTTVGWLVVEIVLHTRQYSRGTAATVSEWRSLGAIVASTAVGNVLARIASKSWPDLDLPIPWLVRFAVVLPVVWFGLAFRLWSIRTLGKYFRVVVHVQAGHEIIQTGPYRWLRHPSYSGLLLALVGSSLLFANVASIALVITGALAGLLYRIIVEERVLVEQLGASYRDYAAHTRRLVPGVW